MRENDVPREAFGDAATSKIRPSPSSARRGDGSNGASRASECPIAAVCSASSVAADDDVEIPIEIDIGGANRDRILCGLERDAAGNLPRHRELDAIRVAVRVAPDVVRDGNVRLAVRIEVSDDRGPAERSGGIPQSEDSGVRRRRFDQRGA